MLTITGKVDCASVNKGMYGNIFCCTYVQDLYYINRGWAKNRLFLTVDNFVTVNGRKMCDTSKASEFCIEKKDKNYVSTFKCSLLNLHKPLKLSCI